MQVSLAIFPRFGESKTGGRRFNELLLKKAAT
jgi:hypothetical protein